MTMRNIFDQYSQPENRLTHALACSLQQDRELILPLLRKLGIRDIPKLRSLRIVEQQVPGEFVSDDGEGGDGLPDMCIFDEDAWAVLFESKVQAKINRNQLERHRKTASKHGYANAQLVVISVDRPKSSANDRCVFVEWRDLYTWFKRRAASSLWAGHFASYLEVFESKMNAQDYNIRGTLTMFHGFQFDADNPYTYREGKRLIRLLGDELQGRKDLHKIGVDPKGKRRGGITGRGADGVWDFLPLHRARNASLFTDFPHVTMGINRHGAVAATTVPNGVKGGFRTKLKECGAAQFVELMTDIEQRLRPILERCPHAQPNAYATQRHYKSQRSPAIVDARLNADLRTVVPGKHAGVKHQPEWIEAIYALITNKRSNIQLGIDIQFPYVDAPMQSPEAIDIFAKSWIAMHPLIEFVLD